MKKGNSLLRIAIGVSLFGLVSVAGMAFGAKDSGNIKNPEMVKEVMAGKLTTANAAWWGFDETDATDALQSAINSGAKKVIVPNMGKDWIVRPIKLVSNQEIEFQKGVVVTAKKGEFKGGNDCLFRADNLKNITLTGSGAILRMQKDDYMKSPYQKAEWRMVLEFSSCDTIKILGLTLKDSGGDGIYLGVANKEKPYCSNVLIKDVVCDNNYRQGISVISAKNMTIENCTFKNTWGTAPEAGIDLEPNFYNEALSNCLIKNCVFENNKGAGIAFWLSPLSRKSDPLSVKFENCRITSEKGGGIFVGGIKEDGPLGLIEFNGCKVENTASYGAQFYGKAADRALIRLRDCSWKNVALSSNDAPIQIALNKRGETEKQGGVDFVNCRVEDTKNRPTIAATGRDTGYTVKNLAGTITVKNPNGAKMDLGPITEEITLKMK